MKITNKKISWVFLSFLVCMVFSSFVLIDREPDTYSELSNLEQEEKVMLFTITAICNPMNSLTRCFGDYFPDMNCKSDLIRSNRVVEGTIVLNNGCYRSYVCDFKVCADKGYAMVRSKGSKEYVSVQEWLKTKQ